MRLIAPRSRRLERATYNAWFLENMAPGDDSHIRSILSQLGKDPDRVLPHANSQSVRSALDAATERARQLGIFGSRTFVCGTEIFWGDDRFEDAIEWAKAGPACRGRAR